MDRIYIRDLRRTDDSICPQVAIRALGSTDTNRLVRELNVQRLDIRFGVDRWVLMPV